MFRTVTSVAIAALVAVSAFAGDRIEFADSSVATNASAADGSSFTNVVGVPGLVYEIDIAFNATATNCDVDIVIVPYNSDRSEITLYSADDVGTSDLVLFPRTDTHTTAGAANTGDDPVPYFVWPQDKIAARFYDSDSTNSPAIKAIIKLLTP
jgi:ABC-type glycerol-3-phosphate transport system substrate-binding protein